MITIPDALQSLRPNAEWVLRGNEYSGLQWLDKDQPKPSKKEVDDEIKRLQKQYRDTEYQRLRAAEYPDMKEYLDGIVKGDDAQVQAYIDACLAVKAKYPKPEGV